MPQSDISDDQAAILAAKLDELYMATGGLAAHYVGKPAEALKERFSHYLTLGDVPAAIQPVLWKLEALDIRVTGSTPIGSKEASFVLNLAPTGLAPTGHGTSLSNLQYLLTFLDERIAETKCWQALNILTEHCKGSEDPKGAFLHALTFLVQHMPTTVLDEPRRKKLEQSISQVARANQAAI